MNKINQTITGWPYSQCKCVEWRISSQCYQAGDVNRKNYNEWTLQWKSETANFSYVDKSQIRKNYDSQIDAGENDTLKRRTNNEKYNQINGLER